MKEKIVNLFAIAALATLMWLIISHIEVMQNQYDPDYVYSEWNFFRLFLTVR